jgi:PAS domain S-box-containing protein
VNARAEKMFDYPRRELIGMVVDNLLPDSLRELHAAHRQGYVAAPHVRSMGANLKIIGRRRDGTDFPIEVSLSPMKTGNGMLIVAFIREARGQ